MKKSNYFKAFEIEDAIQAGVNDFTKLSGYKYAEKVFELKEPVVLKKKNNHSWILLAFVFLLKLVK